MSALYGLIGYPLSHSFSPIYFGEKFASEHIDATYELFPLTRIEAFPELLKLQPDIRGLNVTIPYKETIISHLDALDVLAAKIGAVNCIAFKNGIRKGYNTDATGFEKSLTPLLKSQHTNALILGTGGASRAVAYVLEQSGIAYQKVSRKKGQDVISYDELDEEIIGRHKLIINATPVGKHPERELYPALPYNSIGREHLLYDLIYNPEVTQFLSFGMKRDAATKNGYEMLILQAEAAWEIWNR